MHDVTLTLIQLAYGRFESVRPRSSSGRIHVAGMLTTHGKNIQLPLVTQCHSKEGLHDLIKECQLL